MPVTVGVNQTLHQASFGMSIAFPDVCKTPAPAGPQGIPIPYPIMATTAKIQRAKTKTSGTVAVKQIGGVAAKALIQSEIGMLRMELTTLHSQMQNLPRGNPDAWQTMLEKYAVTAAALYLTMMAL